MVIASEVLILMQGTNMEDKDKSEPDVDEKLIKWNDVFQELLIDSKTLIKDLSEGINYIAISALILVGIGLAALVIGFDRGIRAEEIKYIASGFIILSVTSFNAAIQFRKWYTLRKRYARLKSLQEQIAV
jgi:hypothetical protein